MWNVRGLGSDKDAEPKTYIILRALEAYILNHTVIMETRHRGGSYEENYNIDGTGYKVFFAGPQDDVKNRNHHGVALAVKATHWAEWEVSGNPSVIELSLHECTMVRKPL